MAKRVEPIIADTLLKPDKAQVYQEFLKEVAESVCALSEDEWNRIVEHSGAPYSLKPQIEVLVAMYRIVKGWGESRTPDARRFLSTFQNATRNMVELLLTVMGNNQVFDAVFKDSDFDSARLKKLFTEFFKLAMLAQAAEQRLCPRKYKTRPLAHEILVAGVASAWESIPGRRFTQSDKNVGPHKYNAMRFLKVVADIADPSLDERKIKGAARAFIIARRSGQN